jgi:glycosyltransferase involved in cell wall biosynthesis
MCARGHAVWIAAATGSRMAERAAARGLPVLPLGFRRPWGAADVLRLLRGIRRLGIQVVNTHSSWDGWMGGLAARLAPGVRVIRTRHLSTPIRRSRLSRLLYCSLADHVVTTGEAIRHRMIQENGFPAARITSVVTGVDLARLHPTRPAAAVRAELGIPASAPVAGTVSTLRSWKGHLPLLEALAGLRPHGAVWGLIVGDGPYREVIRDRVAALGLEDIVRMPGQREDVPDCLAAMDVFAFPSLANEGVPQAVLQAMALRCPVVASDVGGLPEVVRDGETGLLVPARDPAALAAAMRAVLEARAAAAARASAAFELVRARYTREAMLDAMERLYRMLRGPAGDGDGR